MKLTSAVADATTLSDPAIRLLETAERLFAIKGLDNVSIREINRESGSRNHTALQYHFGGVEQLIQAILDYRILPLNQQRLDLLNRLKQKRQTDDNGALIAAIVTPFTEQLLAPVQDSYYISLMAQLLNRADGIDQFMQNPQRNSALREVILLLQRNLPHLPKDIFIERMGMLGTQVVYTVAQWEQQRRGQPGKGQQRRPQQGNERQRSVVQITYTAEKLRPMTDNLISFLLGGLTAPMTSA